MNIIKKTSLLIIILIIFISSSIKSTANMSTEEMEEAMKNMEMEIKKNPELYKSMVTEMVTEIAKMTPEQKKEMQDLIGISNEEFDELIKGMFEEANMLNQSEPELSEEKSEQKIVDIKEPKISSNEVENRKNRLISLLNLMQQALHKLSLQKNPSQKTIASIKKLELDAYIIGVIISNSGSITTTINQDLIASLESYILSLIELINKLQASQENSMSNIYIQLSLPLSISKEKLELEILKIKEKWENTLKKYDKKSKEYQIKKEEYESFFENLYDTIGYDESTNKINNKKKKLYDEKILNIHENSQRITENNQNILEEIYTTIIGNNFNFSDQINEFTKSNLEAKKKVDQLTAAAEKSNQLAKEQKTSQVNFTTENLKNNFGKNNNKREEYYDENYNDYGSSYSNEDSEYQNNSESENDSTKKDSNKNEQQGNRVNKNKKEEKDKDKNSSLKNQNYSSNKKSEEPSNQEKEVQYHPDIIVIANKLKELNIYLKKYLSTKENSSEINRTLSELDILFEKIKNKLLQNESDFNNLNDLSAIVKTNIDLISRNKNTFLEEVTTKLNLFVEIIKQKIKEYQTQKIINTIIENVSSSFDKETIEYALLNYGPEYKDSLMESLEKDNQAFNKPLEDIISKIKSQKYDSAFLESSEEKVTSLINRLKNEITFEINQNSSHKDQNKNKIEEFKILLDEELDEEKLEKIKKNILEEEDTILKKAMQKELNSKITSLNDNKILGNVSLFIQKHITEKRKDFPNLYAIFTESDINKMTIFISSIDDIKSELMKITEEILKNEENKTKKITKEKIEESIKTRIKKFRENNSNIYLMLLASNQKKNSRFFLIGTSNVESLLSIILYDDTSFYYILKNKDNEPAEESEYNKVLENITDELIKKINNLKKIDTEELKNFILKNVKEKLNSFCEKESKLIAEKIKKNKKFTQVKKKSQEEIKREVNSILYEIKLEDEKYNEENYNDQKIIHPYLKKSISIFTENFISGKV